MTTIFDRETEIGRCDPLVLEEIAARSTGEEGLIVAHTRASLARHMLKIEQRCLVRLGEDVPEQPWVRPEMVLEPATGDEQDLVLLAEQMHATFVDRVRQQIPENCLV